MELAPEPSAAPGPGERQAVGQLGSPAWATAASGQSRQQTRESQLEPRPMLQEGEV